MQKKIQIPQLWFAKRKRRKSPNTNWMKALKRSCVRPNGCDSFSATTVLASTSRIDSISIDRHHSGYRKYHFSIGTQFHWKSVLFVCFILWYFTQSPLLFTQSESFVIDTLECFTCFVISFNIWQLLKCFYQFESFNSNKWSFLQTRRWLIALDLLLDLVLIPDILIRKCLGHVSLSLLALKMSTSSLESVIVFCIFPLRLISSSWFFLCFSLSVSGLDVGEEQLAGLNWLEFLLFAGLIGESTASSCNRTWIIWAAWFGI